MLRRADRAEYVFTVTASDRGMVPCTTSAIVRIQVSSTQPLSSLHHLLIVHLSKDTV